MQAESRTSSPEILATDLMNRPNSSPDHSRDVAVGAMGLAKTYGVGQASTVALSETNLNLEKGSFTVLLGPSGCGKTTLLRLIAGLIRPSGGSLQISGEPLWQGNGKRNSKAAAQIGMVFQDPHLMPWRNVVQNIALPLELKRVPKSEKRQRVAELIALLGLEGAESLLPRQLSGGMRQRVAIARSLSHDPDVLLLDEPFAALDAFTRDNLNLELQRIWLETKKSVILVTHSITEAVFLANRVILLSARPGRVVWDKVIDFARPRELGLHATVEFQELVLQLRQRLERGPGK